MVWHGVAGIARLLGLQSLLLPVIAAMAAHLFHGLQLMPMTWCRCCELFWLVVANIASMAAMA
jgi:hypothetical protein